MTSGIVECTCFNGHTTTVVGDWHYSQIYIAPNSEYSRTVQNTVSTTHGRTFTQATANELLRSIEHSQKTGSSQTTVNSHVSEQKTSTTMLTDVKQGRMQNNVTYTYPTTVQLSSAFGGGRRRMFSTLRSNTGGTATPTGVQDGSQIMEHEQFDQNRHASAHALFGGTKDLSSQTRQQSLVRSTSKHEEHGATQTYEHALEALSTNSTAISTTLTLKGSAQTRYLFWFRFDVYNQWCQKMFTIPTKMYAFTRHSTDKPK